MIEKEDKEINLEDEVKTEIIESNQSQSKIDEKEDDVIIREYDVSNVTMETRSEIMNSETSVEIHATEIHNDIPEIVIN